MPARRTSEDLRKLISGAPGECWHLPAGVGGIGRNGYTYLSVSGQKWLGHRLVYTLLAGPIPVGLTLDHLCHTRDETCKGGSNCPHRRCVNPAHLEPVTRAENNLRGRSPAADNARKETCDKGHPLTGRKSRGRGRYCSICRMENRVAKGETSGNGHWRDRTHCPQGHPYDETNTYVHRFPDGSPRCRMCRTCQRLRARDRAARRKAAA